MIFPGCEKIIPEFRSICRSTVEFKAILSGVACARDDAVGAIHRPWCAMVVTNCRKINFRQRLQDGLSFWPLQGKQCSCVRLIGNLHIKIAGLLLHPGKVIIDVGCVDDQHVVIISKVIDNQVVDGASIW